MTNSRRRRIASLLLATLCSTVAMAGATSEVEIGSGAPQQAGSRAPGGYVAGTRPAWTQWGGPKQNFHAPAGVLAESWPEGGPEQLWSRPLGSGYSAILFENDRLYTMYREDGREAIVCIDATTGETLWEHRYENDPRANLQRGYGIGPRSTPLLVGDLLFTIGLGGRMHALDKSDGRVLWIHDLIDEGFSGKVLSHGYSSSPVAYEDIVIAPVGGDNAGLVALDQRSGEIRWAALDFDNSYSSPRIVEIAGEQQLLVFMAEELVGVDPSNGDLLWRYPHSNQWGHNITMPIVIDGDTIFLSSPQTGARGLRLRRNGDSVEIEQVWSTRRIQFYHAATVRLGDWVYGSTGVTSPAFMAAVNVHTGEIAWRQRGFGKANCVEADGKLVILDENGVLYLASATPEELIVHSRAQLLDRIAWTVPTIVGQTMFVRDNQRILALDLS